MAGGLINTNARSQSQEVGKIHDIISTFVKNVTAAKTDAAVDNFALLVRIPAFCNEVVTAKAAFDAMGFPGGTTKTILENDRGYADWTGAHTTAMNDVITLAGTLKTTVEGEVDNFPMSYTAAGALQWITGDATAEATIIAIIDDIIAEEL